MGVMVDTRTVTSSPSEGLPDAQMERAVLAEVGRVLPSPRLPQLLWWVGCVRPAALWEIEERGYELASAMEAGGKQFRVALARWVEALGFAHERWVESGEELPRPPIWCFWSLFTRKGEPESPLSALLREEVGYPADDKAGPVEVFPVIPTRAQCYCCGETQRWRLKNGGPWICPTCHPPIPAPEEIEWLEAVDG